MGVGRHLGDPPLGLLQHFSEEWCRVMVVGSGELDMDVLKGTGGQGEISSSLACGVSEPEAYR